MPLRNGSRISGVRVEAVYYVLVRGRVLKLVFVFVLVLVLVLVFVLVWLDLGLGLAGSDGSQSSWP